MMKRILVIEDDKKHINDAKKCVKRHPQVSADYAKTYDEATKLIEENSYDGIISDIFFPCNDKREIDSYPEGWSSIIQSKCYKLLISFGIGFDGDREIIKAANEWIRGKSMHPTGVVIADMAIKNQVPIVLCTDTYHHGNKTEPINQWARKNKITLIDGDPEDRYEGRVSQKNWEEAVKYLMEKIKYGEKKQK